MKKTFETDWLNTEPVFYNEKTKKAGYNINDVIEYDNLEFDPEGLVSYLDFGYSVLGMTPVKNVKFLRHSAVLEVDEGKSLNIKLLEDPAEKYEGREVKEEDIWEKLHAEINSYDSKTLIVPTSGGFDSRILNFMTDKKEKILAYTYGISEQQFDSSEVQNAKHLCEELGIKWQWVKLEHFNRYIEEWEDIFGASVHTHGMYHMEFYKKIIDNLPPSGGNSRGLISGIIGDAWAGTINATDVPDPAHFSALGFTHGLRANSNFCAIKSEREITADFLNRESKRLKDSTFWQVILVMRLKMMLLRYIIKVPKWAGIPKVYAPYLNMDIALSMLNLPPERRNNRVWQREFFAKNKIDIENHGIASNPINLLDWYAMQKYRPKPLDVNLLSELFAPEYLGWINNNYYKDPGHLGAMSAYYTLRPIETLLKKRGGEKVKTSFKRKPEDKKITMYIGANFIPRETNQDLFAQGALDELVGKEITAALLSSDLNIFNLELPLTYNNSPIVKSGPALKGLPESIRVYRQLSPLVFTLANNHISDYGGEGVRDTLELLKSEGISSVGAGMNLSEARKSFIYTVKGKKIGVYACAENECTIAGENTPGANPFDPLESYDEVYRLKKECHRVIVLYHGGKEEYRYPSPRLQKYCRKFTEKGADLVVCQHSHTIGCYEQYQNGAIIYGQGNFLFNIAEDNEHFNSGLLLKITIDEEDKLNIEAIPLIKSGVSIRLANNEDRRRILSGFTERSREITVPGFIEKNYEKFAKENVKWYLSFYYWNYLNDFMGNLPKQAWVDILNNIRCESHRELFSAGLKALAEEK